MNEMVSSRRLIQTSNEHFRRNDTEWVGRNEAFRTVHGLSAATRRLIQVLNLPNTQKIQEVKL